MCASLVRKDVAPRALREAAGRKARKVHLYQNGRPYTAKLAVSLIAGKDFHTFEQLCEFLSEKSQIPNGVQYIFTTNGQPVCTLDELEHGQSYVISGTKTFVPYPYGLVKMPAPRISRISNHYKLLREDDLRLLRPLSSKYNNVYSTASQANCVLPNNPDSRIITVINNRNHSITSKVILNLKTPKSFDCLLRDLGQAVRMNVPKRMFTTSGLEVKSVSHLKHDLAHIDVFYIDPERSIERLHLITKFPSLESIENHLEKSVHRLNQISYHSSNIDIRPNNDISSGSLLSMTKSENATDKQWQTLNDVTTFSVPNITRKKSNELIKKSQSRNAVESKIKNQQTRKIQNGKSQIREIAVPDKNMRKRSLSKLNEPAPQQSSPPSMEEDAKVFSLESISTDKFEQIQQYVERMLQETSAQIRDEGLLRMVTTEKDAKQSVHFSEQNRREAMRRERSPLNNKEVNPILHQKESVKSRSGETIKKRLSAAEKNRKMSEKMEKPFPKQISSTATTVENACDKPKIIKKSVLSTQSKVETQNEKETIENNNQLIATSTPINSTASPSTNVISSKSIGIDNQKINLVSKSQPKTINLEKTSPKRSVANGMNEKNNIKSRKYEPKSGLTTKTIPSIGRSKVNSISGEIKGSKVQQKTISEKVPSVWKNEKYLQKGSNTPKHCLELTRIFGFNGGQCKNLFSLATGELVFYSGVFAIIWNPQSNTQRFYTEHDSDIYCLRVDKKSHLIATSQLVKASKMSIIRLWSVKTLATIAVLRDRSLSVKITDMEFTINNSLFVINSETKLSISVWDCGSAKVTANASKALDKDEIVFGGAVHPQNDDIMVTYGKMHLVVWSVQPDNSIGRTALQTDSIKFKSIHCADFLGDNSLLTGDGDGNLTIWAPFEANHVLEFAIKEVKGHEAQLTCLKLTSNHILISGDRQGTLKTWDVNEADFRLLNAIKLPASSGLIGSIAFPDENNLDIFVGTSENFILKGSALQSTSYEIIFEGHVMAIRTISFDPQSDHFYTASLDQQVCKWDKHSLIWRSKIDVQAISSAVHPTGQILAIGSVNGIISILKCATGEVMQHLEITSICIGCMSYSADGNFLVAGCQDGNLHVLPSNDEGHTYSKVSVLKGPLPILTLQWSLDTQFILTSVDDNNYQELILWDLHNTRYIRNVTNFSDNLRWYQANCSGLEDARGTWDNEKLQNVINICTYYSPSLQYILTGDENGYVRLFSHPCTRSDASFFEYQQGGGSVTDAKISPNETCAVTCNFEGSTLVWSLKSFTKTP